MNYIVQFEKIKKHELVVGEEMTKEIFVRSNEYDSSSFFVEKFVTTVFEENSRDKSFLEKHFEEFDFFVQLSYAEIDYSLDDTIVVMENDDFIYRYTFNLLNEVEKKFITVKEIELVIKNENKKALIKILENDFTGESINKFRHKEYEELVINFYYAEQSLIDKVQGSLPIEEIRFFNGNNLISKSNKAIGRVVFIGKEKVLQFQVF